MSFSGGSVGPTGGAASVAGSGGMMVVTRVQRRYLRVFPPAEGAEDDGGSFSRGVPITVGMLQIIVSVVVTVLGSIIVRRSSSIVSESGVYVWGPLMCFFAGIMTITAGTSSSRSLVKHAAGVNTVAAVFSIGATVVFVLGLTGIAKEESPFPPTFHERDSVAMACSGFSFVLCFLQFSLAVIVATSDCRGCNGAHQGFTVSNVVYGVTPPLAQAPPTMEVPPPPYEKPPAYSNIMNCHR